MFSVIRVQALIGDTQVILEIKMARFIGANHDLLTK